MNIDENNHIYKYSIESNEGKTIQQTLIENFDYSSRLIRQIKREGQILLNNKKCKLSKTIYRGDEVIVDIGKEELDVEPQDIPIDIIYEDFDIVVINKQPGIVTHPTRKHSSGTMANAIANHWAKKNISAKVRFVNRLDRDTSGAIVIAKNKFAHQYIQKQMKEGIVEKIYWAVCEGTFEKKQGVINLPIGRENETSIQRKVMFENGSQSITHYKVIKEYENASLLQLLLETGRTHQIRVHLQHIKHPIIGDTLYNENISPLIERQALHAKAITFKLPRLSTFKTFEANIASDINNLLETLDKN